MPPPLTKEKGPSGEGPATLPLRVPEELDRFVTVIICWTCCPVVTLPKSRNGGTMEMLIPEGGPALTFTVPTMPIEAQ